MIKSYLLDWWTFPFEIIVVFGHPKHLIKHLKSLYVFSKKETDYIKEAFADHNCTFVGRFVSIERKSIICIPNFKKNSECFGILQHELLHAIFEITRTIGIKYNKSTEEVFTYLLQHLTEQILEQLK